MSKSVALYVRVSTLDKQIKGLKSQEQALLEYCKNHSLTSIKIYRDKMSGGKIERPQLKKLQKDIFMGKISTVVVWKLDRLSRSLKDGINLLVDWLDSGIRVVAVAQQFDLSNAVGKLIASVLLGIAEMERQNIRENIIRGIRAAQERGVKIGGSQPRIFPRQIEELKAQGYNMTQIAEKLNCTRQALYKVLKRQAKKV
ncbi:MAG: recombinase family protein [Planctomycetota bacterium]|jgi:DNA invertase Pin-like site-specific DNA recombinase